MKKEKTILDVIVGEFEISRGSPLPMGATLKRDGINFSIFSKNATSVSLVILYPGEENPIAEFPLDPKINKTGYVWHAFIRGLDPGIGYGYRLDKRNNDHPHIHRFNKDNILIDPYAKAISGGETWRNKVKTPKYSLIINDDFDWEFEQPLNRPLSETIIYEMHVRGFTRHDSSAVSDKGTFSGLTEKIPYLQELGINAIELLPISEFEETEYTDRHNPMTGEHLVNFWGYNSFGFFSPKASYAANNQLGQQVKEFKTMVKKMHKAGIEIILDVVFNHTAEGDERGPVFNFRGIDNSVFYIIDPVTGAYHNYSGCGNTVNCNHPFVRDLILDCLRYWVTEMHIDGFRFDLASILGRDQDGSVLSNPPLIERIAADPILANTKIIAEAWDASGLYQVGTFPAWRRWAEWNGKFRDDVRRFVKGDSGLTGALAYRLTGSSDLYESNGRTPFHSINFLTSHDGFTLLDLVTYQEKHNESNGENSADGSNTNHSWNCGVEGETKDKSINQLRTKQIKNLATILMLSSGVPMILSGDEFGRTQMGNNNAYCHDNEISWLNWNLTEKNSDLFRFWKLLIKFRKSNDLFRRETFQSFHVEWHGHTLYHPDWSSESRVIGMHLFTDFRDRIKGFKDIYMIFNSHWESGSFELPHLDGKKWHRVIDTHLNVLSDILEHGKEIVLSDQNNYLVNERSVVVLAAF